MCSARMQLRSAHTSAGIRLHRSWRGRIAVPSFFAGPPIPVPPIYKNLRVHSPDGGEPEPLFLRVATLARQWEAGRGNVGLVVGATYPHELASVRERCPDLPLLIPGVGTQRGDLEASVAAGLDATSSGIVINASRSVIFASSGADFATAARAEAQRLRDAINAACAYANHQGAPR